VIKLKSEIPDYFDHSNGAENLSETYTVQAVDGDDNASHKVKTA
jgi:hypothetical protein